MKLPDLPDPDEPKVLSTPRDLAESLWFGAVTARWLSEDAGHLPTVSIYDQAYGCECEFFIDADGPILDSREQKPYTFIDEDGESFTIPRVQVGPPPPEDQYLAFLSLLESHSYDRKYRSRVKPDGFASYQASTELAVKLAHFLETFGGGYLFQGREVSVGALIWAASEAGVVIEDYPYGDFRSASKYAWQSGTVFLLLQNTWLDLPLDAHADLPERNPVSQEILNSYLPNRNKSALVEPPVKSARFLKKVKINDLRKNIDRIEKLKSESTTAVRRRNSRISDADKAVVEKIISLLKLITKSEKSRRIGCHRWALVLSAETGWAVTRNDTQAVSEKLKLRTASKVMVPASWIDPKEINKAVGRLTAKKAN